MSILLTGGETMNPYYFINDLCVCCGAPVPGGRQVYRECEREPDSGGAFDVCLLDLIAIQTDCTYLSDLRFMDSTQRAALAERLKRLTPRASDLRDWNDALQYLTGDGQPRATAEEARAALIAGLSAR